MKKTIKTGTKKPKTRHPKALSYQKLDPKNAKKTGRCG